MLYDDRPGADRVCPLDNPGHTHAHLELNLLERGSARFQIAGRFVDLAADRLLVFWGAQPHAVVERSPDCCLVWTSMPIRRVLAWEGFAGTVRRLLAGGTLLGTAGAGDSELLARWLEDVRSGAEERSRICALEMEARLRRLAIASAAPRRDGTERPAPPAVQRMLSHLDRRWREACTLAEVGATAGMHPQAAARLFHRHCGLTIHQYLISRRLHDAQRALLLTRRPVLTIALDAGFGSLGRFYAAFAAAYGCAPGEWRRTSG